MNIPEDLRYTADHEWVRVDGTTATVGITDYAQDSLGDVVYVDLPEIGAAVTAGDAMSEVESTKSVSDIISPIDGTITEANDSLDEDPGALNSDPYGSGWICKIDAGDPTQFEALLDAAAYRDLIGE